MRYWWLSLLRCIFVLSFALGSVQSYACENWPSSTFEKSHCHKQKLDRSVSDTKSDHHPSPKKNSEDHQSDCIICAANLCGVEFKFDVVTLVSSELARPKLLAKFSAWFSFLAPHGSPYDPGWLPILDSRIAPLNWQALYSVFRL